MARASKWTIHSYWRADRYYHRYQFSQALYQAAESGNAAIVEWLFNHFSGCIAPAEVMGVAARSGRREILEMRWRNDAGRGGKYFKKAMSSEVDTTFYEWMRERPAKGNAVTWGGDQSGMP